MVKQLVVNILRAVNFIALTLKIWIMKKRYLLLFLIYLIIGQSCKDKIKHLPVVNLTSELSINQFSDSSYFSDIRSLYYNNGRYFASDYKRDQIFILNGDLELQKTLGVKGRGPGELLGASHIYVHNDTIFVYNDSKKTIELFNNAKHLQTIGFLPQHRLSSGIRFSVHNNEIYFSSFYSPFSISKYDYMLDSAQFFGRSKEYRTPKERRIKNHRHIHIFNNRIVAIPDCQAFVELYSLNGEFINSFDLSNISPIKEMLEYIGKNNYAENSYFQFFSDSYVFDNNVFILITTVEKNDKKFTNNILQLEIINDEIRPVQILNLGNGWFDAICVSENKILAFNCSTAELVRYAY